ncbi:MAG TPA: tRNA lysidine(34) synthetase TilS [Acetobacteraceae bacterium]|nr:tRNA lysidine(34) synthetase TilS [Acetobacteraceae bacterium]
MDHLGPYEPGPTLAVAVSGGADSMALAILTRDWVRDRGGSVIALVVDHGLRPASGDEARLTVDRLRRQDIPARLLTISNLTHGAALAERARISRYEALTAACAEAGIVHLLLGHHLGDQVETLAMRVLRGSLTHGLAGMAALRETTHLRLLRPLLGIEPGEPRRLLNAKGIAWVEDPSNQNLLTMRARMRQGLAATPMAETGLRQALGAAGRLREREEAATAAELADRAVIRPEGFALLSPGRISAGALAALIQAISGAAYPPGIAQVSDLASDPKPATVAGVRLLPAGRFGEGWLVIREEAAIGAPVPATNGAMWDGRFRTNGSGPAGATIGHLGDDAVLFKRGSRLPAAVLRTLPAVRMGEMLASVPHLGYGSAENLGGMTVLFSPRRPAAAACFVPAL